MMSKKSLVVGIWASRRSAVWLRAKCCRLFCQKHTLRTQRRCA